VNVGGSATGAVFDALIWLLTGVQWVVIIAVVISWVNPDPRNPIVRFLWGVTEPLFRPFRRLLPPSRTANIDLSPIFVLLIIFLLIRFLTRLAYSAPVAS
jgi:YggT family protein